MNDTRLVHAKFHLTGFDFEDGVTHVRSHRAVFGFGIRPRGPSTLPKRPTERIMFRRGDHGIIIRPALRLNLVDHVIAADKIWRPLPALRESYRLKRSLKLFWIYPARSEERPCRGHLIGMLRIHTQAQMDFHGLNQTW